MGTWQARMRIRFTWRYMRIWHKLANHAPTLRSEGCGKLWGKIAFEHRCSLIYLQQWRFFFWPMKTFILTSLHALVSLTFLKIESFTASARVLRIRSGSISMMDWSCKDHSCISLMMHPFLRNINLKNRIISFQWQVLMKFHGLGEYKFEPSQEFTFLLHLK